MYIYNSIGAKTPVVLPPATSSVASSGSKTDVQSGAVIAPLMSLESDVIQSLVQTSVIPARHDCSDDSASRVHAVHLAYPFGLGHLVRRFRSLWTPKVRVAHGSALTRLLSSIDSSSTFVSGLPPPCASSPSVSSPAACSSPSSSTPTSPPTSSTLTSSSASLPRVLPRGRLLPPPWLVYGLQPEAMVAWRQGRLHLLLRGRVHRFRLRWLATSLL
jgi:hypothetical protein